MITLSPVITAYFAAANAQDVEALVACFAKEGEVKDEGGVHQGHVAIAAWNRSVSQKYSCTHIVKSWIENNTGVDVTAEVSGTFPGSPLDLTFRFKVEDSKIRTLQIG